MMLRKLGGLAAILLLVWSFGLGGCSDDCVECVDQPAPPALDYVGTPTCGTAGCHDAKFEMFMESGHPYKLNPVVDGVAPTYPWDVEHNYTVEADGPAPGTAWTDFAYVIGGYGWKARFVKPDGNVYTTTEDAQLNLHAPPGEDQWVAYHLGEVKKYDYSCFRCHTTGASPDGSWPEGSTGYGTFQYGGVECEECHGLGSQHAFEPTKYKMNIDASAELCGRCHTRDGENRIAVSGGKIKHHEQYDEMIHSPHANISNEFGVGCNACHDPHASVKHDGVAAGDGVRAQCLSCHPGYDYDSVGGNLTHEPELASCTDCHMPKAAKSARADNEFVGDIASHIFSLRTDEGTKDTMWTADGAFVKLDEFGRAQLTLDFACYGCHTDPGTGEGGGTAGPKDMGTLSAKAMTMHGTPAPARVSR